MPSEVLSASWFDASSVSSRSAVPISELDLRSSCAAASVPSAKRNVARPRDQKAERHRLRIAVGELRIVGLREEKLAPVLRKAGERRDCRAPSAR